LWAECRQVTKQAMVSLFGNRYQVDPALVGATVELVFDPFDLARIEVRYRKRPMGAAVPFQLGRHVHPAATPDPAEPVTPRPSGIDYLALVEARTAAAQRRRIAYALLPELPAPNPAAPDRGVDVHEHDRAATVDPGTDPSVAPTGDPTTTGPLGVGLHLAATITPARADQPTPGGSTTKPPTNIGPIGTGTAETTTQTETEDAS
jgi:hypothetical protein